MNMTDKHDKLILVVDDVQMNIEILLAILGPNYNVAVALDGQTALTLAKQDRPDLILLDVIMPKMNGFEVCKKLKEDASLENIPVIFLSALNEEKERKIGLSLGAIDFIDKPFEIDEIRKKVNGILLS